MEEKAQEGMIQIEIHRRDYESLIDSIQKMFSRVSFIITAIFGYLQSTLQSTFQSVIKTFAHRLIATSTRRQIFQRKAFKDLKEFVEITCKSRPPSHGYLHMCVVTDNATTFTQWV